MAAEPTLVGTAITGFFATFAAVTGKWIEKRRSPLDDVSVEMEQARELNEMLHQELHELRLEREALRREISEARAEIAEIRSEVYRLRTLVRSLGGEP